MVQSVTADAGPARPDTDQIGSGRSASVLPVLANFGLALTKSARTPLPRKSQTICVPGNETAGLVHLA
jgi:hypothetical protein